MNLTLSPIQKFPIEDSLELIPLTSDWGMLFLTNPNLPVFDFMKNSPQSMVFKYKLKPKSSYFIYVSLGYTNLKVRGSVEIPTGDPFWLDVVSDWYPVANYTSTNSQQYKDIDIIVMPSLAISQGTHHGKIKFHIEGERNGIVEVLSTYEIPVVLNVFEEGYFYSPDKLTFYHTSGNTAPLQNLQVGGNNWQLNVPKGLVVTGPGIIQNPDGTSFASGSGLKSFAVTLHSSIDDLLGTDTNILVPVTIVYPSSTYTVPVTVIRSGGVYPINLSFNVQNGSVDAGFKLIHINRPDAFSVTLPPNSNINYELLDTIDGKKIKVFLIDPSAFGSGIFTRNLSVVFSDETYNVGVTISVGNQFDLGLDLDTIFTHSMKDLVFTTNNEGSYIDMWLSVVGHKANFNYKFPFFQGKANKNIGKALSNFVNINLQSRFSLAITNNQQQRIEGTYPLNYFNLDIKERKNNVDLVNFNRTNLPFVLGYKPKLINNKGILQHNTFSRFTPKSFALVSVFSQNGSFDYKIMKNGTQVHAAIQQFGYLRTLHIDFSNIDAKAGDIIDFVLVIGNEEIKKSFVIFPETTQNINIVYTDSFGLHSNINFTGNTKNVNSEFNFKVENFDSQTFIHTRKYVEKQKTKLQLNTGFLLQSQSLEIAELMKAKKAWVVVDGIKVIEIIPVSEKITEISNDEYMYDYAIEFEINKENYAQDYNF